MFLLSCSDQSTAAFIFRPSTTAFMLLLSCSDQSTTAFVFLLSYSDQSTTAFMFLLSCSEHSITVFMLLLSCSEQSTTAFIFWPIDRCFHVSTRQQLLSYSNQSTAAFMSLFSCSDLNEQLLCAVVWTTRNPSFGKKTSVSVFSLVFCICYCSVCAEESSLSWSCLLLGLSRSRWRSLGQGRFYSSSTA